jgi:hypothetical protein
MASKKATIERADVRVSAKEKPALPALSFSAFCIFIGITAFVFYFNTLFNEYALDDVFVISGNAYTMKGFSGIYDLFTRDTFGIVTGSQGELSGGRYRPLSVATFAMEIGLFGENPLVSHLINVLLYCSVCMLLLKIFYTRFFPGKPWLAFLSALLFTIHPVHTEAVANIKGRDELLAFLLLLGTVTFYFRFLDSRKRIWMMLSVLLYFISLFSKESGIPFLVLLPLTIYFFKGSVKDALISAVPLLAALGLYFFVRYEIVGFAQGHSTDLMNAPFFLASRSQALATKVMILGKYLLLLFFPYPLSFDYSYPQIPYVELGDVRVILSLLVNTLLVLFALKKIKSRHVLSYSILFYFITLSIVSNFVFDVGAPLSDRFLFQPSVGFCIALAWLALESVAADKKGRRRQVAIVALCLVFICSGIQTIARNAEWKNNDTLFEADVKHSPNSAKTNRFFAVSYIKQAGKIRDQNEKRSFFDKAETLLHKSVELYPNYADAHMDLGVVYVEEKRYEESKKEFFIARKIYPGNTGLKQNLDVLGVKLGNKAIEEFKAGKIEDAIRTGTEAVDCSPSNALAWFNLGGYYLSAKNTSKARESWIKAHELDPSNAQIKMSLDSISK